MRYSWAPAVIGLTVFGPSLACSSNVNKIAALCSDLEAEAKASGGDCAKLAAGLANVFTKHQEIKVFGGPPSAEQLEDVHGPCLEARKVIDTCRQDPQVAQVLETFQRKPQAP
jgi:hypothetical protein